MGTNGVHPALAVKQLYQKHFESVTLAHLADLKLLQANESKGDSLREYILCTFVNATEACKREQQNGAIEMVSYNVHQDIIFHLLAQEARVQGLSPQNAR